MSAGDHSKKFSSRPHRYWRLPENLEYSGVVRLKT